MENKAISPPIILVAEDDEGLNRIIQKSLRREGFHTSEALNGADTIANIARNQNVILLLDYKLPDMTGKDVVNTLVKKEIDIPFIVITGHGDERIAVEMMKMGASDYLIKDVGLPEIIPHVVKRVFNEISRGKKLKQTEMSLQQSEERYKRITRSITDYIYTVRIDEGMPVDINHGEACCAVTGFTRDEFADDPCLWIRMVVKDDQDLVKKQIEDVLNGTIPDSVAYRVVRKDGAIRWVENSIVPAFDATGNLIEYDGIVRDITENKRLECQLLQSQKIEAIGQLAGGVAHDFNNILTAIISYGYLLKNRLVKDDPLNDNIDKILVLANKASTITQGLLTFSRKQYLQLAPVSLNDIICNIENLLSKFIGEEIEITTDLTETEPIIIADRIQIEQVIINLTTNARDAMFNGGNLFIKTRTSAIDSEFIKSHGFGKPGNYAILSVTDNGSGMDEETSQKIFEPFFTTKETGKGTGLGLAVTYGIVKQHHGYISVHSQKEKGTTFNIYLPEKK